MSTFATLDGLRDLGFSGFLPFRALLDCLGEIPAEPGVYVVAAPPGFVPRWREVGSGGHFKGEDPNVPQSRLSGKWVPGAAVLYFGKAGAGATGRRGLRRRLEEYARFGGGEAIGHRGGRLIWQVDGAEHLLVAWKPIGSDHDLEETRLLRLFRDEFGTLPFANLATKGA